MAVLKYSDLVDSGLFVKTSTKGQPNGVASLNESGKVPVAQLATGTASQSTFLCGNGSWATPDGGGGSTGNSSVFTFKVTFNGSNVSLIENAPTGWTISASGSVLNISHNLGTFPKLISYLGFNNPSYHYRTPTEADEALVGVGPSTSAFSLTLTNTIAGAQSSGHAYVSILF